MTSPGTQYCVSSKNFLADVASKTFSEAPSMISDKGIVLLLVVGRPLVTGAAGSSVGGGFLLPVLGGGRPRLAMGLG